jgi:fluoride ion exporter CrcB/FEX
VETFAKILSVAIGGATGATARYLINISPMANLFEKFPFPTFLLILPVLFSSVFYSFC